MQSAHSVYEIRTFLNEKAASLFRINRLKLKGAFNNSNVRPVKTLQLVATLDIWTTVNHLLRKVVISSGRPLFNPLTQLVGCNA